MEKLPWDYLANQTFVQFPLLVLYKCRLFTLFHFPDFEKSPFRSRLSKSIIAQEIRIFEQSLVSDWSLSDCTETTSFPRLLLLVPTLGRVEGPWEQSWNWVDFVPKWLIWSRHRLLGRLLQSCAGTWLQIRPLTTVPWGNSAQQGPSPLRNLEVLTYWPKLTDEMAGHKINFCCFVLFCSSHSLPFV